MSPHRVVSGDVRVVVQEVIYSGPSSFTHFDDANATFVDKTLAIEAFYVTMEVTTSFFVQGVMERATHSR